MKLNRAYSYGSHKSLEPVHVTLFTEGVFEDVIALRILRWDHPRPKGMCTYEKQKRRGEQKRGRDWEQRLQRGGTKRGKQQNLPWSLHQNCYISNSLDSNSSAFLKINFCYFNPLSVLSCALVSLEMFPDVANFVKVGKVEIWLLAKVPDGSH